MAKAVLDLKTTRALIDRLGAHVIGHISHDSTAIEARESLAKKGKQDKTNEVKAKVKRKRGRSAKGEVHPPPEPSVLQRQQGQRLEQMLAELNKGCATGTKVNAQGYKISWKGYKLHLDTACCGACPSVPCSREPTCMTAAQLCHCRASAPSASMSATS